MIELEGLQYNVQTPSENVMQIITQLNNYCVTNDIRDVNGNIFQVEVNASSPFYLLLYGLSYQCSLLQNLLYSLGRNTSISSSSEKQLRELMRIAQIHQKAPTYSTILGYVTAGSSNLDITASNIITTVIGTQTVVWTPMFEVHCTPNQAKQIMFSANVPGAISLSANYFTGFDVPIASLAYMETSAAIPGQPIEPLSSVRNRVLLSVSRESFVDRAIQAINNLQGVSYANIYFNDSIDVQEVKGTNPLGYIRGRQAIIFVQGYSPDIASTYLSFLTAKSQPIENSAGEGMEFDYPFIIQEYTQLNGQVKQVYLTYPKLVPVFVRVYPSTEPTKEQVDGMKQALMSLAMTKNISQGLSSRECIQVLIDAGYGSIVDYVQVACIRNGAVEDLTGKASINSFELLSFISDNMDIVYGLT